MTRFILLFCAWMAMSGALAADRFPRPDFESGHVAPKTQTPLPRDSSLQILDAAVLFLALALASYIAIKRRPRREMSLLTVFSLLYFGFWRKGCVCAIGAVQNVALMLADPNYAMPCIAVWFFVLPLFFAIFVGRTFCAAVCPLGALQDVVAVKPMRVPFALSQGLKIIPWIYLGLAVLFAVTGAGFVVCRYDPFVGFFRMSAAVDMVVLGAIALVVGVFIARPYCRFFCPYGVLLGLMSRIAITHVAITPDECVRCRLCEESCPFGAIRKPEEIAPVRPDEVRRLGLFLLLAPMTIAAGAWLGGRLEVVLSKAHPVVQLSEQIRNEDLGKTRESTLASQAFRGTEESPAHLFKRARDLRDKFYLGGLILGAFVALVISCKLIGLSFARPKRDFYIERAECISCGRCFASCPQERVRRENQARGSLAEGSFEK